MHFIVSRSCSFSYAIPSLLIAHALSWFSRFILRKVLRKEVCCLCSVFSNLSLKSVLVGEFMCLFVSEFIFLHVMILRESLIAFFYVLAFQPYRTLPREWVILWQCFHTVESSLPPNTPREWLFTLTRYMRVRMYICSIEVVVNLIYLTSLVYWVHLSIW